MNCPTNKLGTCYRQDCNFSINGVCNWASERMVARTTDSTYFPVGHLNVNEYGFVSAHVPDLRRFKAFVESHFATFPTDLIEPCILAGCPAGGTVLDPFGGAGTTGLVADRHGRDAILIELNPEYAEMARARIISDAPLFAEVT